MVDGCKLLIMRNISIFFLLLSFLVACGCSKEKVPAVVGNWELSDIIYTKASQIGTCPVDVSLTFRKDGSFEMKQIVGEGLPKTYAGTWAIAGDVLSGTYNDGSAWGASYSYSVEGDILTLVPLNVPAPETYLYTRLSD